MVKAVPTPAPTHKIMEILGVKLFSRRKSRQPAGGSLQTPVERSERVAGCWAVRARANPLSLGVWQFTRTPGRYCY